MPQRKRKHKFNDVLSLVLAERKNRYASLTSAVWEEKISRKISSYFENKYIEQVDEIMLNHFFGFVRYKENGELISDKYMKAIVSLMKSVMKKSFMKGYISINPFDYDYKPPKGKIPQPTERIISDKDLQLLFKAVNENQRFKIIIPMLLNTGMRIGELLGLYWSDVDFDNQIIHVQRAVCVNYVETPEGEIIAKGMKISATKTQNSVREIPVNDLVINLLIEWLEYRDERKGWKKAIYENDNQNLIFPNYAGRITNPQYLYQDLMDFLKEHNLDKCKIMFHKLRHCYATHMLDAGVDIDVISKLLGHKSITTTANTYVKVQLKPKIEAVKKHDKYMQRYLPELY